MRKEDIKVGVKVKPKFDMYLYYRVDIKGVKTEEDYFFTHNIFTIIGKGTDFIELEFEDVFYTSRDNRHVTICTTIQTIPQLLACFEVVEDEL